MEGLNIDMEEIVNYLDGSFYGKFILVFFIIGFLFSLASFSSTIQVFFNWLLKRIKFLRGDEE